MVFQHGLKSGDVIINQEIVDIFKCGNMGGMRFSRTTNSLVLVADYTKSLYKDEWKENIFHYTGMGKIGDQSLLYRQNRTLAESYMNSVSIFLFEVKEEKKYTFIGQVELAGEPYQQDQEDIEQKIRKVWVFPLRVIN